VFEPSLDLVLLLGRRLEGCYSVALVLGVLAELYRSCGECGSSGKKCCRREQEEEEKATSACETTAARQQGAHL